MRRHGHRRARGTTKGVSIIEGLVVIGIMTIVLVMITQIFSVSYDMFIKQTARIENDTGAILAARTISEAARGAVEVVDSATINSTLYTTSDEVLVVKLPAIDSSYDIVAAEYDYMAIYRDATATDEIWSDTEPAADSARPSGTHLLSAHNSTMTFRYDASDVTSADRVTVYLVNSQVVRDRTFRTRAWTSVFIRNR